MTNLDYLYNETPGKRRFTFNYFVDKELGFKVIERGVALPYIKRFNFRNSKGHWGFGGLLDSEGNFIKSSFVHSYVGEPYMPSKESVKHSSETVIYLGMFHNTWGHVITDNIRRLWFLKSEAFKNEFKNCPLICILCMKRENFSIAEYSSFRRLLEILEVDVDKIQTITQPTQFEKIILPDESFYCEKSKVRRFTVEYCELIRQIKEFALKNRTPTASKKIYYFYGRKNLGEERMAEYFKSKGYEIVRPEILTLDEQLNLLINCESFASTIGSCAMNSLFLREGTETIFIPRAEEKFGGYQNSINQICSLKANYVDSSLSVFHGLYCFIISEQLKRFFGDKFDGYTEDDFKVFLEYIKSFMQKTSHANPRIRNYSRKVLSDFLLQLKRHESLIAEYDMPPDWDKNLL